MKHDIAVLTFVAFIFCAVSANAQTFPSTIVKRPDYTFKTRAYIDSSKLPSRYDLRLFQDYSKPYHWDFTIPGSDFPRTQAMAAVSPSDYGNHKQTIIRATLRQSSSYTEKVTFKNLDLAPPNPSFLGSRALLLHEKRSITTPSGITVTLPVQSYDNFPPGIAGNPNALFISVEVTPNTKLITSLPKSPLFRKHHFPVSLRLGVTRHAYGEDYIDYYKDAKPAYDQIGIEIPNLKTAMHLDQITFYVRQRVDLQTVSVAIEVPISRPAHQKTKSK
jgi:hypothetical protein